MIEIIPYIHWDKKDFIEGVLCVYGEITTNAGTHGIWIEEEKIHELKLRNPIMRKATKKTLEKIKHLHKQSKTIFARNLGDAYPTHYKKEALEEYVKTGIYNPNRLITIEKWINSR